ncbi:MAG: hypothetical protein HY890_07970 [Deltaproteobacteria bacterium]|nr:hypothetical protein [Deltaproteobacteria bacterium]
MPITLTTAFLNELKKNSNQPNVIIEVALDSGTLKWGYSTGGFTDVLPILKSVSSLQNKLDTESGYSTRGQLTLVITGRDNFKTLIKDNYLKNRRIARKDGFVISGFAYSDYAQTFTGRILDWTRKGDELTITIGDDLAIDAKKKIPVENATKTQYLDYRNMNPVDIMQNILKTQLGISASLVDDTQFDGEQGNWLNGWVFDRVLTKPEEANKYLNELQLETNSFIIHDGEKITYKVFAPPLPGQTIEEWTDAYNLLRESFSIESGYKDNFFNRVVLYYDYDESGNDKPENFETIAIAADAASQGASQWAEIKTKEIKSRWIRTRTFTQPTNITGAVLYHVSVANGAGSGTLTFNYANNTLKWTAPGGAIGAAITLSNDGLYQVYDADQTKYARVIVTKASLPVTNQSDTITLSALNGAAYAAAIAQKILSRYRDPSATVGFDIDINGVAYNSVFIKPTDLKDLTTDEACNKGSNTWSKERMLLTLVRPDYQASKVHVEALQTKMYRRYGFIAPAGYPDYPSASASQKERAFIGNSANKVNGGTEDGYYIW